MVKKYSIISQKRQEKRKGCIVEVRRVPGRLNYFLRDYQRDGVEFLWDRYCRKGGGILADDMGKQCHELQYFYQGFGF